MNNSTPPQRSERLGILEGNVQRSLDVILDRLTPLGAVALHGLAVAADEELRWERACGVTCQRKLASLCAGCSCRVHALC